MTGKNRDRDPVLSPFKKRKVRFANPTKPVPVPVHREAVSRSSSLGLSRMSSTSLDKRLKGKAKLAILKEKYQIKKLKIHLDRKEVSDILQRLKRKELPKKPVRAVVDEKVKVKAEPRQTTESHEPPQIPKNNIPDSPPQVKPIFFECPSPFIKLKKEKENGANAVASNKSHRKNIEVEKKLATIKKTVKKVFETSDNLKSVLKSIASFPSPEKPVEKHRPSPDSRKLVSADLDNQWVQQDETPPVFKSTANQYSSKEIERRPQKEVAAQKVLTHTEKSPEVMRTSLGGVSNRNFGVKSNEFRSELKAVFPKENAKFINQKSPRSVPSEKPVAPKGKPMVDVSVQALPSCVDADSQTCIYELTSQKVLNPALGMLPVDTILSKCERLIRVKVFDEVKNKILNMSHKYYKDPRIDDQYAHRKRSFQCDKVTALHIYSFLEECLSKDLNEYENDMNSSKLTVNNGSSDQNIIRSIGSKTNASNGEDHTYTLPPSVVSKNISNYGAIKTVPVGTPLKIQMCSNMSIQKSSQKLKSVTNCVVRSKPSEMERKLSANVKLNMARASGIYSVNSLSIEDPTHKSATSRLGPLPNFASIKHNRAAMSSTPEMTE